jgi:hypothetical protein
MKYFELIPTDQREYTWILFRYTDRVRLRPTYQDLQCKFCRKFDEETALRRGIEPDVSVVSDDDYLCSWGNFIVISCALRDDLAAHGVSGIRSYPIPGDPRYVIAWPSLLVPTDPATAGIKIQGPICPECGRPHETCFTPRLSSMKLPTNTMTLFASELWVEKSRGKMTWFTTSETVVKLLRARKTSGIEYQWIRRP